jgi:ribosomal protein S18 acetylase RimI-like enzyme
VSLRPGPAVEAATWVPLRVEAVGPWRVGLSHGFTRRGNSALLVDGADGAEAVAALDDVERLYASADRPTIVRLGTARSPDPSPAELTAELAVRGYRTVSTTRVLTRVVAGGPRTAGGVAGEDAVPVTHGWPDGVRVRTADEPDEAWLRGWLGTKAATAGRVDLDVARGLLTGAPARYLTAADADGVVGTIRAAVADSWVGLSCLVVDQRARRRGLGRRLTEAALAAHDRADRAFLQVEVHNAGALALYRGLGFAEVDEYTYAER